MKKLLTMLLLLTAFLARGYADTWTVAGQDALTGHNWDVSATENEMTAVAGTTLWTLTKTVTISAGTYEFKVAKDQAWDTSYPDQNQSLTIEADGTYDITFWYNTYDNSVYGTYAFSVIGNLWDNWVTDKDMTQSVTDENIFTLVVENFEATAQTYEYKVRANHNWKNDYENPAQGNPNKSWECTEAGTYTLTFTLNMADNSLTLDAVKQVAPATGYTVDFNTEITTTSHDFAVAPKWKHIVQDNDGYYVNYKWDSAYGVNSTGGLLVYSQRVGSSSWDMANVYDLLVTPKVSGTIKLKVKAYENASSSTKAFVQLWSVNGTATEKDTQLKEFQTEIPGYSTGTGDWVELTYDVTEAQRIGIRAQYVYIDDFSADAIDTTPEAALVVSSVMNSDGYTGTQGTNPVFEQQADGNMKVILKVTLANTGDVDFVAGTTENYTLTPAWKTSYSDLTYYENASIAIPEDIAAGETKTFDVEFTVPYTSGYKYWHVRENVTGTTSTSSRYATSVAYESKFVLREAGSTSTTDLTTAQAYGRISTATTRSFEIYNDGTAPLTIMSITLPEGFTSDNLPVIPTEGLVLAKKTATDAFNVTLPVTTTGDFSGNLVISYVKAGDTEATNKTLPFSGTVLAEGTWFADFNGDPSSSVAGVYPEGSVVTSSTQLQFSSTGSYGSYDHYLKPYSSAGMLVMPKLTATAGAQLKYDAVKYQSGSSYTLKVYVSTDRNNLGEAKVTINNSDLTTTGERYTQTLTFDQAGDYYVAFELYGVGLDNVIGLTKTAVAHDLYLKNTSLVAEAQTGKEIKPSVTVIPLTTEAADAYTVKYYVDGVAVAAGTAVAMDASATSDKTFTISYTPNDAVTTEHDTYIEFEFTDGTKIATEHQTLKVTNEPKFLFVAASTSVTQYTTNLTTAQAFGKVNVSTESKSFKIYNQGTAPLNVTSIVAPEGFSVNKTEATIAAGESEDIVVTFSATTPGEYAGNLVVSYTQDGAQTYELAFSGTMLDHTKWYANFDDNSWPAGSVYQDNVSLSNIGTYSVPNYAITCQPSDPSLFVTPKLTATAGEKLSFDAKLYSTSWKNGKVVVYAAASREEVLNAEDGTTRVQLFSVSGMDSENPMTTDFQTFEVTVPTAGDYYLGFAISGRPYVDEIYGLTLADVAHDLQITSSSIPSEAMQNHISSASVNVLNLGLSDDNVTVTAYVDGEAVATGDAVTIPMSHKLSDAGTKANVNYTFTKAGVHSVYLEVKAGEYSVVTDPVDVTFAEEEAINGDVPTGEKDGTDGTTPLNLYYKNSETIALYTQSNLGLNGGEKIKSITWKGYTTSSHTSTLKVYYEWTDDKSISTPSSTSNYDVTGMTAAIEPTSHTWTVGGSANELQDQIVVNFSQPITYVAGKSLRILVSSSANSYGSNNAIQFEKSKTEGYAFQHQNDGTEGVFTGNWSAKNLPLIHLDVESSAATLSGTVKTSDRSAIEGATVTLKAANGVEYSGATDATGAYSINVIQAGLDFTATVEAAGYLKRQFALNMNGASATSDVTMYTQFGLVGTLPGLDENTDVVMTATEDPNIFTLEMNNVAVTAGDYWYKLRADGAWNLANKYQLPSGDDNFEWTFNTSGTYNYKFTFDWTNHTLTFERPFTLSETADGIADLNWVDVTVDREFKAGWNAVVLPFGLDDPEFVAVFGANSEVAVYDGDTNNNGNVTVNFKKQDATYKWIEAGVPYLIWLEQPVNGLNGKKFTKDISSTLKPVEGTTFDFVGTYTSIIAAAGDYFIAGGQFVKATSNNTIKPFRSYLKLKDGQTARSINFVVGDDVATDIDGLTVEHDYSNDTIYNLSGQKVQQPTKRGIYIINGKKVMVK